VDWTAVPEKDEVMETEVAKLVGNWVREVEGVRLDIDSQAGPFDMPN
jgi:hypothetical protein